MEISVSIRKKIDKELDKIEDVLQKLADQGAIACKLCFDVGCAMALVDNQILESRLKIWKMLGGDVELAGRRNRVWGRLGKMTRTKKTSSKGKNRKK